MSHETFALINDQDQVINHIVIDKDDANFEENMAGQLTHWGCVRYVETTPEDVIILDESPEIWTTHSEDNGFTLPDIPLSTISLEVSAREIKKSELPADSLLLEENADNRPEGWEFPYWIKVIEG
jgi:hypothetical protein